SRTAERGALPDVRLEVRQGPGRGTNYPLAFADFLIGTVPGCDLRVSGTDLPAVLCLIARRPDGVHFRKLAPTKAILINGNTAANGLLKPGDRMTLGALGPTVDVETGTIPPPTAD